MNSLLEQLHDIEGLDSIDWWPLAIGWWVLIVIALVLGCFMAWSIFRWIAFKRSWKNDTFKKLRLLEKELSDATARYILITLSEYLRRIALQRFSRKECAGLTGEAWLQWLTKHDPKEFDWKTKGSLLIDIPYAPVHAPLSIGQIKDLIQAAKNWVR